jgi:hypothetical protein
MSTIAASRLTGIVPFRRPKADATRLLFIHGRSQERKDPSALKAEWLTALRHGAGSLDHSLPDIADVAFPYYGDLLDEYTKAFAIPLTSNITARGGPIEDEFLMFQAEVAESVRRAAGVTDAQVDLEYGTEPTERGPLNWKWVQAILRAVDKHGGGMNQKTLETFTRDVFLYATRAGVRDAIDDSVGTLLTEQPTVVVSHSLGTVVAYSVLRREHRRLQIPLFVTVGSPLAVRAIRDQFKPLRSPAVVGSWYNAFDSRDVVALYPLDKDNFPVEPAIVNNSSVRNSTDNRHGISGYLENPDVARRIVQALS